MFWLNPYNVFCLFCAFIVNCGKKGRSLRIQRRFKLDSSVSIGDVRIIGNQLKVGRHSYINSGHIATNHEASVIIGNWCAIGHNVTILAFTHETGISTGPVEQRPVRKGNVIIEDGVWIGSNVIITPGVTIGKLSVIGGNSVVTKDVPPYTISAGIPARVIHKKSEEDISLHEKIINCEER